MLIRQIWGSYAVVPPNLLRAIGMSGSASVIAMAGDAPVGFGLGVVGWRDGLHFHSHQVGVLDSLRGTGIGYAIKLYQRALCLAHGIEEMRWTYDPLLMANARFNLVSLGARITEFIPNCYGVRDDNFNAGDVTDRVKVSWKLTSPVGGSLLEPGDNEVIEIPSDYLSLKKQAPDRAAEVRGTTGSRFAVCSGSGRSVLGLCGRGYVVARS